MLTDLTENIKEYEKKELEGIKPEKSDNSIKSDSTITINNDTSVFEEIKNKKFHEIFFKIENTKISYDSYIVKASCPALNEYISKLKTPYGTITINLPKWIKKNDLLEYFFYYKNGILLNCKDGYYKSVLKIADFFENFELIEKIVTNNILPCLNETSALIYLAEAYEHFSINSSNNASFYNSKILWFDLLISCKEYISKNLTNFLLNQNLRKTLLNLKEKVNDDIIDDYIRDSSNNYDNDTKNQKLLIDFICEYKKKSSIIDLINSHYLFYNYEINDVNILENLPIFEYYFENVSVDSSSVVELPLLRYDSNIDFIFIISYNKEKDILSINIRERVKAKYQLASFSFYYFLNNEDSKISVVTKDFISSFKESINLLNFSQFSKKQSFNHKISMYIKLNSTHSFILNYFLKNFNIFFLYFNQKNKKIHPMLILNLFLVIDVFNLDTNKIMDLFMNWLDDYQNLQYEEEIKSIMTRIQWGKINKKLIYKFVVKYANLLGNINIEEKFINEVSSLIDIDIYYASKEVNYLNLVKEKNDCLKLIQMQNNEISNTTNSKDISAIRNSKVAQNNFLEDSQDKNIIKNLFEEIRTVELEISKTKESKTSNSSKEAYPIKRRNKSQIISQFSSSISKSPNTCQDQLNNRKKNYLSTNSSFGKISCKTSINTIKRVNQGRSSMKTTNANLFLNYSKKTSNNITNNSTSNYFSAGK